MFSSLVRLSGEGGVQEMGNAVVVAELAHGVHLILHEGYKRGYDNGCTLHKQRGKLVA